jgi:hypothetical protein
LSLDGGEVTAMGRWLSLVAIACAVSAAGCGSKDAPAAKNGPGGGGLGQAAVGQWSVIAIDGKPIPEGSSVSLDYRPDGQLVVETTGNGAPSLDKEALKAVLNGVQEVSSPKVDLKMIINSLTVKVNGRQLELKRKSGTASGPSG